MAAVWRNVQVHEFAFGMGPGLLTKRAASGTLWSIRAFPIGGFVRLEGDEDETRPGDVPDPSRAINKRRPWERFIIFAGGAAMNIVLAWLLTTMLLSFNGVLDIKSPVVGNLMPGYPAETMGALPGDRVVSINGREISEWPEIRSTLQETATDDVVILVDRSGESVTLSGKIPFSAENGARLWGVQPSKVRYPVYKALFVGVSYCWQMSIDILKGLMMMLSGAIKLDAVTGPVGIADMAGQYAREGFWSFITFLAVINLNLGLLNLLPFPALDGGRLVFLLGEMISGRKFPEKWENRIHLIGFVMLLVLIVVVTWKDIAKLWLGQ
jgi:regulator of sigma E protease